MLYCLLIPNSIFSSRYDNDRTKFIKTLLVNMSYSTWNFITPSPSLGWLFWDMVLPRFVSMWQGIFGRNMLACWCLLITGFGTCVMDITLLVLHQYFGINISLLPYRPHYVNCPGLTRASDIFSTTTFYSRPSQPRTSSWRQSLVILPRSRDSVIRQLSRVGHRFASSFRRLGRARTATCSLYVLAALEPSTSAVPLLLQCSHATSVR